MDYILDNTTITLEVLNVYDIKDPKWCFLTKKDEKPRPPMKIVELTAKSADWVRNTIPKKEVKKYRGHFMVLCSDKLNIPIGNADFILYEMVKGVYNIEYREDFTYKTNAELVINPKPKDLWDEFNKLMKQKKNLDLKIETVWLLLQNSEAQ